MESAASVFSRRDINMDNNVHARYSFFLGSAVGATQVTEGLHCLLESTD